MLDSVFFTVAVGTALGFLSGLGIGGGSLLILWLTLVQNVPQETARVINLMFFLPAAAISVFFRFRRKKLRWTVIIPALAAGIAGALLLGMLAVKIDAQMLRVPFGILLLATGIREVLYRPKNRK